MSNISASAFSVTAPKAPPIPPLQLKSKKSQGSGQLSTTDEYYKLHKQKILEQRRTNSQMQLQRIEGVVSPIQNKHGSRDNSIHSAHGVS
jgi:hypothetical protein